MSSPVAIPQCNIIDMLEYTLIKSKRKTISIELREDGLIVRAPLRTTKQEADEFVRKHKRWIENHQKKLAERKELRENTQKLTPEDIQQLANQAMLYIPMRVRFYADRMRVKYGNITIRLQKTRWGSCSTKKNLNFNALLMLTPPEVIDSVVVHELCHLKEMNHSPKFYELVNSVFPDYDRCNKWLKDNGQAIMAKAF